MQEEKKFLVSLGMVIGIIVVIVVVVVMILGILCMKMYTGISSDQKNSGQKPNTAIILGEKKELSVQEVPAEVHLLKMAETLIRNGEIDKAIEMLDFIKEKLEQRKMKNPHATPPEPKE